MAEIWPSVSICLMQPTASSDERAQRPIAGPIAGVRARIEDDFVGENWGRGQRAIAARRLPFASMACVEGVSACTACRTSG